MLEEPTPPSQQQQQQQPPRSSSAMSGWIKVIKNPRKVWNDNPRNEQSQKAAAKEEVLRLRICIIYHFRMKI